MDANTELLLNITKQLGGLSADMATVKESLNSFKEEMAQLKKDVRDHEGIHVELAPKKDLDELWTQIRQHNTEINELKQKDANKALERDKKIKDQLLTITVGLIGTAGIGVLIYAIADNIIRNSPR